MRSFHLLFFSLCSFFLTAQKGTVLFFVAQDSAYWSEYIVCREALVASGYTVDLRSAIDGNATTYMTPSSATISSTANTLTGSSFAQFSTDFENQFGDTWDNSWNVVPSGISVQGSIQSVPSMDDYVGLIIAGGTGIQHYRVDGSYSANGTATATQVQAAAEKLNALAIDALEQGKPVLGQCHGASLPVYWRVLGTSGPGEEALGFSILKEQNASGFPEVRTGTSLASLTVNYLSNQVVCLSTPHSSLNTEGKGDFKVITSRDWYPQSVAHATKTFINVVESYPSTEQIQQTTEVLILHGGAVNKTNCGAWNKSNDIPCNYGTGSNLPADYTHLQDLLSNNINDGFQFNVTSLDLSGSLPFNSSKVVEVEQYLNDFDVVVFFKHWSTFLSDEIQYGLKNYTDQGSGLVSIHHGLYNDVSAAFNKDILVNEVLGVSSEMSTWSAKINDLNLFNTNYGHFISSYMVEYPQTGDAPVTWQGNPNIGSSNLSRASLPYFTFYEEIYNNTAFTGTPIFGNLDNQITALFSNNLNPAGQVHTSGFCKLFNPSLDGTVGRIVCLSPGERQESFSTGSAYGQVIRNAVLWSANKPSLITSSEEEKISLAELCYPNPFSTTLHILTSDYSSGSIYDLNGELLLRLSAEHQTYDLTFLAPGVYLLQLKSGKDLSIQRIVKH